MTNRLKRMLTSSRALESRVASVVETAAQFGVPVLPRGAKVESSARSPH